MAPALGGAAWCCGAPFPVGPEGAASAPSAPPRSEASPLRAAVAPGCGCGAALSEEPVPTGRPSAVRRPDWSAMMDGDRMDARSPFGALSLALLPCAPWRPAGHVLSQTHVTGCVWVPARTVLAAAIALPTDRPWDRRRGKRALGPRPHRPGARRQPQGIASERDRLGPGGPVDGVRRPLDCPGGRQRPKAHRRQTSRGPIEKNATLY